VYYGLPPFFFPLSARGPTRRRNPTGLAELWGGWPIELEFLGGFAGKSALPIDPKRSERSERRS